MRHHLFTLIAMSMTLFAPTSQAAFLTFTDRSSFDAALANTVDADTEVDLRTIDFEDSSPGDLLPPGSSLGGVTFSGAIDDGFGNLLTLSVSDFFDTTSGNNYLGVDDPANFDQIVAGAGFNMNLGGPFNAIGMYFITGDPLLAGDIILNTPIGAASNSDAPEFMLDDGGLVYFVGLLSEGSTFGLADIRFGPTAAGAFLYNVDDIAFAKIVDVSEPPILLLVSAGLLVLVSARRRAGLLR